MRAKEWEFQATDWKKTLSEVRDEDFVYADPPYIGRYTDYYNGWSLEEAGRLAEAVRALPCGFAVSMWKENRYRKNGHLEAEWNGLCTKTYAHFYHVGPSELLRNPMIEALIVKPENSV
jgi:DNA adenine methylase